LVVASPDEHHIIVFDQHTLAGVLHRLPTAFKALHLLGDRLRLRVLLTAQDDKTRTRAGREFGGELLGTIGLADRSPADLELAFRDSINPQSKEAGNDILLGGAGKDTLKATGTGRDLLIGGSGADSITGNGNAILISGTTSYGSNLTALDAILAEWASTDGYSTRINDITTGGGLNNSYMLNSSTVIDDLATNNLSDAGTSTGDWFVVNPRDKVTIHNGETVTVI
jgi:hypothetical protein